MTRTAVLVDFGGVLTTSVLQAFEDFGVSVGAARGLLLELLSNDAVCRKLLVEHESGRIDADAFDRGFAERLHAHGVPVDPDRLSVWMQAGLRRDDDTVRLIEELRTGGVPIALVSNAFGRDCYAGFDLNALRPTSPSSPTARSTAASESRCGAPTSSSSRATPVP